VNAGGASRLERTRRLVSRLEDGLLALLLTGMILLAALQIFSRNLFSFGFVWGEPLLRMLVLWLALLGAMAATRDGNHIHIDLLSRFLPEGAERPLRRLTDLFSALACGLAAWHAARFVLDDWQYGMEWASGVPSWLVELIIPIGFGVMALRFLLHALFGPPAPPSPPEGAP
jgi:TRAP-type C4-dicarboxylate transport system permease small subunit